MGHGPHHPRSGRGAPDAGEGLEHEGVAGVDRLGRAPAMPDRRHAAPVSIAVLEVVVDERRVVQELQPDADVERVLGAAAEVRRAPHGQERAQALPAGRELVVQHLAHETGRGDALAEPLLELRPPSPLRLVVADAGRESRGASLMHGCKHR